MFLGSRLTLARDRCAPWGQYWGIGYPLPLTLPIHGGGAVARHGVHAPVVLDDGVEVGVFHGLHGCKRKIFLKILKNGSKLGQKGLEGSKWVQRVLKGSKRGLKGV